MVFVVVGGGGTVLTRCGLCVCVCVLQSAVMEQLGGRDGAVSSHGHGGSQFDDDGGDGDDYDIEQAVDAEMSRLHGELSASAELIRDLKDQLQAAQNQTSDADDRCRLLSCDAASSASVCFCGACGRSHGVHRCGISLRR